MSHTLNRELELSRVLNSPIFTEKTARLEEYGQYVFKVCVTASKADIKEAIEHFLSVKVAKVRTTIVKGKAKRTRYGVGCTQRYKKAMVQLVEGQVLPIFEEEGA